MNECHYKHQFLDEICESCACGNYLCEESKQEDRGRDHPSADLMRPLSCGAGADGGGGGDELMRVARGTRVGAALVVVAKAFGDGRSVPSNAEEDNTAPDHAGEDVRQDRHTNTGFIGTTALELSRSPFLSHPSLDPAEVLRSKFSRDMDASPSTSAPSSIIVAGQDSTLTCFEIRRGQPAVSWTTTLTRPVSCMSQSHDGDSLIVLAVGTTVEIREIRSGRILIFFDTNLTQDVRHIQKRFGKIHVCSTSLYNRYDASTAADDATYQSSETINCMALVSIGGEEDEQGVALACSDDSVRIIDGSSSTVIQEISLPAQPLCICSHTTRTGLLLIALANVTLVLFHMSRQSHTLLWTVKTSSLPASVHPSVNSLMFDDNDRIILCRGDGFVQVFSCGNLSTDHESTPVLLAEAIIDEDVTAVAQCVVNLEAKGDRYCYIATTFSGRVLRLKFGGDADVWREIEPARMAPVNANVGLPDSFDTRCTQTLIPSEGHLSLVVEATSPISFLTFKGDSAIGIHQDEDPNLACGILSIMKCGENEIKNKILSSAAFRATKPASRICLQLWPSGQSSSNLVIYVASATTPKVCRQLNVAIKPLWMHERTANLSDNLCLPNRFCVQGEFTVAEAFAWLSSAFDGLPERPPNSPEVTYKFRSSAFKSHAVCNLARGTLTFDSDSVLAVGTLRDHIATKANTGSHRRVSISVKIENDAIKTNMRTLLEFHERHALLVRELMLAEGVSEVLRVHNLATPAGFMDQYLTEVFAREKESKVEVARLKKRLPRVNAALLGLLNHARVFEGLDVAGDDVRLKDRLLQLQDLADSGIGSFESESVMAIFDPL